MKKAYLSSADPGVSLRADAIRLYNARRRIRLMLLTRRIGPSRYPQAGRYDSCARPPRSGSLRSQRGFTLLEAAIAMTLLTLITTVLYGGFHLGHRAMESWQHHAEASQRLRSAEDFFGSYIRSAHPYRLTPRDQAIVFSGEESRLIFVSAISAGLGGRGMAKISLYWESDQDDTGLLVLEEEIPMRWESQESQDVQDSQASSAGYRNKMVLRRGVKSLRIHYLEPQSEEERWVEEWDGKEKRALPRAVRLSLEDEEGKEIEWLFPIMISVLTP